MPKIVHPRTEYRINPMGIDGRQPRFSWQTQCRRPGIYQIAYQITAASSPELLEREKPDLWDSGRVESDQSLLVPYAGKPLTSRQRVYWRVVVWDDSGEFRISETAWFETGLLEESDWQAEWIGGTLMGGAYTPVPAPYLRHDFELATDVQSARLYITALGFFECSINGHVVGDDIFAPGWTDYNQRIQYQVYDVTELLQSGANAIGAILGDGWAVGKVGMVSRQQYERQPQLLAQLEVTLSDGSTTFICSDGSWKHQYGPLLDNDMQGGEAYDARLEFPGWAQTGFDESRWLPVKVFDAKEAALVAHNGPQVKRIQELSPIGEPRVDGDLVSRQYIFDMGQNMVGRVRLKGSAPAGTTVTLRFAEVLDDEGDLYTDNLRDIRVKDYYTFKGEGEEIWEPKFTFHGFRYVELVGYPGEVRPDTITGIVLHSDMAPTGSFTSSDPLINQLQHNIQWGQKGNFLDIPTDCPQRDERLGWTGDIQVFVRTAAFNMDVAGFMTKWLQDVADAQSEKGEIPAVVPNIIHHLPDGGPAWADAAVICPWTLYLAYGDTRILEQNYDVMARFMRFLADTAIDFIRCAPEYAGWPGFGDWLSINADTPRDLIGTAFMAYDAQLMAQIATVLGKEEDAAAYMALHKNVVDAFRARYLKGSDARPSENMSDTRALVEHMEGVSRGNLKDADYGQVTSEVFNAELFKPEQTAYVLALQFDLLPEELRAQATEELVKAIEQRDWHLSTGFAGAPYLPHVLSNNGRADVAYALLKQTTWPSWLYPVTQDATTIWERWDGWTEENGFQDDNMNSFNHYAYGSIGAWLYNTVTGIEIDPEQPGYKHIILQPQPGGDFTRASGELETPYGKVVSSWTLEDGAFTWNIVVPPNAHATATLPDSASGDVMLDGEPAEGKVHELPAGEYQFVVG